MTALNEPRTARIRLWREADSFKTANQLPVIIARQDELAALLESHGHQYSCNPKGEVWPKVCQGLTPQYKREYLEGHLLLDRMVRVVLAADNSGGRFYVRENGIYLSATHEQIARIRVIRRYRRAA